MLDRRREDLPRLVEVAGRPWRRPWSTSRPYRSCGCPQSAGRWSLRRTGGSLRLDRTLAADRAF
jgi:hypothetical protein